MCYRQVMADDLHQASLKAPVIDWSIAPKGARWWAMNEDRCACWFSAPSIVASTSFWFSSEVPAPQFDFEGDWRLSLSERPEGV